MSEKVIFSFGNESVHYHHTITQNPDPDRFPFRLHSHVMHEIYYFAQGDADLTVEGTTYHLEKGMLLLSASGQVHHLSIKDRSKPYERIVFMFSLGASLLDSFDISSGKIFHLNEKEQIWFEECCLGLEKSDLGDNQICESLTSLINVILTKLSTLSEISFRSEPQKNETVNQILRYINRNLTSSLSLDIIEKELFRDKAYLNRVFKSVMGCSIWEYVIQKRVFNARQQLYLTKSVSSAFASSGFRDYSVFYRNYIRCTGISPCADLKTFTEEDER